MSFNGYNVPDDMRYSDYWDDSECICPQCDSEMTLMDGDYMECDNKDCGYTYYTDDDEPDPEPPEEDFYYT